MVLVDALVSAVRVAPTYLPNPILETSIRTRPEVCNLKVDDFVGEGLQEPLIELVAVRPRPRVVLLTTFVAMATGVVLPAVAVQVAICSLRGHASPFGRRGRRRSASS
jgi:hypothetical protein